MTVGSAAAPVVSVVIPTRNRCALLARALGSVLAQTHEELEVIVVDEASTDRTPEVIAAVADPRVRLLRHEIARGAAGARNAGVKAARGRWCAFLDDDDLWAPTKLASQLGALEANPGARWSCVAAVSIDDRERIIGWHRFDATSDLASRLSRATTSPAARRACSSRRTCSAASGASARTSGIPRTGSAGSASPSVPRSPSSTHHSPRSVSRATAAHMSRAPRRPPTTGFVYCIATSRWNSRLPSILSTRRAISPVRSCVRVIAGRPSESARGPQPGVGCDGGRGAGGARRVGGPGGRAFASPPSCRRDGGARSRRG